MFQRLDGGYETRIRNNPFKKTDREFLLEKKFSKDGYKYHENGQIRSKFPINEKGEIIFKYNTVQIGRILQKKKFFITLRKQRLEFSSQKFCVGVDSSHSSLRFYMIKESPNEIEIRNEDLIFHHSYTLKNCTIQFTDHPFTLKLTNEKTSIFLKFEGEQNLCNFKCLLIEGIGCRFHSRFSPSKDSPFIIKRKLKRIGFSEELLPSEYLTDPDLIRHVYLSSHTFAMQYDELPKDVKEIYGEKTERDWRISSTAPRQNRVRVILYFSEDVFKRNEGMVVRDILCPISMHDYGHEMQKKFKGNEFRISCSLILEHMTFEFNKFGLIVPSREVHSALSGHVWKTLDTLFVARRDVEDYIPRISKLIAEWNSKFDFSPFVEEEDEKYFDPDEEERMKDLRGGPLWHKEFVLKMKIFHCEIFSIPKSLFVSDLIEEEDEGEIKEEEEEEFGEIIPTKRSADFVREIFRILKISFNSRVCGDPNGQIDSISLFMDKISREGFGTSLTFYFSLEFKSELERCQITTLSEKIEEDESGFFKIVFENHLELDMFARKCIDERLNDIFQTEMLMLKNLDRMFWVRHFEDPENKKYQPMEPVLDGLEGFQRVNAENRTGCPFVNPRHYWRGYLSEDY